MSARRPLGSALAAAGGVALALMVRGQEQPAPPPQRPAGAVGAAVARVAPSVVRVELLRGTPRADTPRRHLFAALPDRGQASGLVVGERLVLTHGALALYEEPTYAVTTASGTRVEATLLRLDLAREAALLETAAPLDAPPVVTTPSGNLPPGSLVLAVGDPFGMARDAQPAASLGILEGRVSLDAAEVTYRGDVLLTDAAINPGSEGGALADLQGRVVGLLAPLVQDRRLHASDEVLPPHGQALTGYAIPIEEALQVQRPRTPATGLSLGFRARAGVRGLELVDVAPDGRADRAGLRPGDVIVSAAGVAVSTGDDLRRVIAAHPVGPLPLVVERSGRQREVSLDLTLAEEER